MCTVTLATKPHFDSGFILTSNRDEAANRIALPPKFYTENGIKMLYPKDKLAGGTWIGISDKKRIICLLNGEFKPHERSDSYRMSRGVVVKDLLSAKIIDIEVEKYNLNNIEPFTVVAVDWNSELRFIELVWDGTKKHYKDLELKPHIWSSSPLYSSEMKQMRTGWFTDFLQKQDLSAEAMWKFHTSAGIGNPEIDVIMDREFVKTQNISQFEYDKNKTLMRYMDLKNREKLEIEF